jgi:hypothetical protein
MREVLNVWTAVAEEGFKGRLKPLDIEVDRSLDTRLEGDRFRDGLFDLRLEVGRFQ